LITGITGQDGAYLSKFLLGKGYKVYGTFRRLSTPNFWRLQALDVFQKVTLIPADLTDMSSIVEALQISHADEVYNLAAQSFVAASFEEPIASANACGVAVTTILEAIRHIKQDTKFYQASTSEMFGKTGFSEKLNDVARTPLKETSTFYPTSPYAAAKIYGYWVTKIYREAYDIFACQGILFNHESPLRGLEFVTRKISNTVAKISMGLETELRLGNITAKRDWGYAPEYVRAMWMMMQQGNADDFVIATNESHSVKEFVEVAFDVVKLDPEKYVKIDKRFMRPVDTNALKGSAHKAQAEFGWKPKTTFKELVKIMVNADVDRWKKVMTGQTFPWDAPNYPSEARIITRAIRD